MPNNVLQQLTQNAAVRNGGMLQQLAAFRKNYRGDPKQAVMAMLQSGQINNAQLQQAIEQAKQLSKLLR